MPEIELNNEHDSFLRRFIERLKYWEEDNPPSHLEFEALKQEFRLTRTERESLIKLTQNHIRRGRTALALGKYEQALAELARASQLKPRDPGPKVELADAYLKRFQVNGSHRSDKKKAVRLIETALELDPRHPEIQRFLRENTWMSRHHQSWRFIVLPFLLVLLIIGFLWWQWDWFFTFFRGTSPVPPSRQEITDTSIPETRSVPVETPETGDSLLDFEMNSALVGRRNDSSYLQMIGSIKSLEHSINSLSLRIQGKGEDDKIVFVMPWTVLKDDTPLLRKGDTLPLTSFRWLEESEVAIHSIQLLIEETDYSSPPEDESSTSADVIWDAPKPAGVALIAEVRDRRIVEAYDRQMLLMDIALENTGVSNFGELSFSIPLTPHQPLQTYTIVDPHSPPFMGGERRVMPVAVPLPLDIHTAGLPIIIHISSAHPHGESL